MSTWLWVALASGLVVLAGGVLYFRRRSGQAADEYLNFNCPGCGRKLRYRIKQAGHSGMCPRCSRPLVFPKA
jgi:hypothetical protein